MLYPFYKRGKQLAHKPSRLFDRQLSGAFIPKEELPKHENQNSLVEVLAATAGSLTAHVLLSEDRTEIKDTADIDRNRERIPEVPKSKLLYQLKTPNLLKYPTNPFFSVFESIVCQLDIKFDEPEKFREDTKPADEVDLSELPLQSLQASLSKNDSHHDFLLALSLWKADAKNPTTLLTVRNLFDTAAQVGNIDAAFNAAMMYDPISSKCVDPDINKAIVLYKQAANENHVRAQFKLGMLMLYQITGQECVDNFKKAIGWIKKAACHNYSKAVAVLDEMAIDFEPVVVPRHF